MLCGLMAKKDRTLLVLGLVANDVAQQATEAGIPWKT